MLAEQAEIMLQLGMDAEGAQLRAKMQSASLTSGLFSYQLQRQPFLLNCRKFTCNRLCLEENIILGMPKAEAWSIFASLMP